MKKATVLILILTILLCTFIPGSLSEEYAVFTGVHWGDSIESVQQILGAGKTRNYFGTVQVLSFENEKFGNNDAQYGLYFNADGLYMIIMFIYDFINNPDTISESYISAFTQEYGTPIKVASGSDIDGSYTEDPDGKLFFWKGGDSTAIYLEPASGSVMLTFRKWNNRAEEKKEEIVVSPSEGEILFRGLEWGTSYKESLKAFPDNLSFEGPYADNYWQYPTKEAVTGKISYKEAYHENLGFYDYSFGPLEVAGYHIREISMRFVYLPGEEGLLIRDHDNTALISGKYCLTPSDPDAAFDDLTKKMTELYGEMVRENKEKGNTFRIWEGANGTMVTLQRGKYIIEDNGVFIQYTFKGADTLIDQAHEAAILEEKNHAESNYNGL